MQNSELYFVEITDENDTTYTVYFKNHENAKKFFRKSLLNAIDDARKWILENTTDSRQAEIWKNLDPPREDSNFKELDIFFQELCKKSHFKRSVNLYSDTFFDY